MKKFTLLFILVSMILSITPTIAQQVLFKNQPKDSVTRSNPRMAANEYVPGELIVKFKDNLSVKSTGVKFKSASVATDALQTKYNVQKAEALFPGESRLKSAQMLTAPNGEKFLRPSLHNIYKLKIADEKQLMNAISDFKADSANVLYAEPNYIISICDDKPIGPILTAEDVQKIQLSKNTSALKTGTDPIVNDPLYNQQWYIPAVKADLVWPQTKGDTTQIIAILDTGVDWLHPDLKNKIWMNPNPSQNSWPDGIVNDIRGWDFINNDNNPTDDNSHGTHVAGIAAAETNNGIGIAGVCPNAKVMAIKVFQSSGRGDASTIAKGIIYASTHGATVINMSFGSYANSQTMDDALANAYANCVLVAAAGNDNKYIGPGLDCHYQQGVAFYPAALSFVLGIQVPTDCGFGFSNYDDNPIYSDYNDLLNYELKAPGTNILSTVPNGGYRVYQGTSMATPIVSGSISLYKSKYPTDSQELMWGNLINTTAIDYININAAINSIPKPKLMFVSKTIVDTLSGDDQDGIVDAGEIIQLWFNIRNTWGQCDSVMVGLKLGEFEDTTSVHIINPKALIGSMSPYATKTNKYNPFKIFINQNITNNRDICFTGSLWYPNSPDTVKQNFFVNIKNGTELIGMLADTLTLTKDKLWLVSGSFKITPTGVLIIEPGTHLEINTKIVNDGKIIAIGKPDSLIVITGTRIAGGDNTGYIDLNYVDLNLNYNEGNVGVIQNQQGVLKNSLITLNGWYDLKQFNGEISESILSNWEASSFNFYLIDNLAIKKCNILNMPSNSWINGVGRTENISFEYNNFNKTNTFLTSYTNVISFTKPNNIINMIGHQALRTNTGYFQNEKGQYWGTGDSIKIENKIYDFLDDASLSRIIFSPYLERPSDSCHGIVWKVLLNGKDVQDEKIDPIGIRKQRFDVYFNRSMNKKITPQVAFGVRYPFSSNSISEDGSWSSDGRIYTVYKTIKLFTGDGINTIRVSGARDLKDWEIPIEDMRFSFLISAAASSSLDFMATSGLGKVNLEWNNSGLTDLMGFNMYRMEHINDTTLTKPALVNTSLITDTLFTDYSGTPNKKYYYFYKVVRTDFSESDSSKVVSATPFTASKGDANGDLSVNVLDITSIVSYLLGQNPTPFIFEAADVNGDKAVNVLDVVSVANVIKGIKSSSADEGKNYNPTLAYINLKPEIIQLKSDAQVQAIQYELQGVDLEKVHLSAALKGFELAYSLESNKIKGVLYNLTGLTIPAGISDIIKIESGAGKLTWGNVFGADPQGRYVTILKKEDGSLTTEISPFGLSVQPNPSGGDMQISYRLPEKANVTVKVFNIMGELVSKLMDNTLPAGNQQLIWYGNNTKGETVKPGVYFIRIDAKDEKNKSLKEQIKVVRL